MAITTMPSGTRTAPVLEVEGLTVEITGSSEPRTVVDGVSFTIDRGAAHGLVGESGSGKSMTLRAISGLLPRGARVAAGRILLDGRDVLSGGPRGGYLSAVRGSGVAMVFQEPAVALNPVMRVGRQITDTVAERQGLSRREAAQRAVELMAAVGIVDPERRAHAYPFELSGGMRQRVMIAAAIPQEPSLLLCDEPTTALDVTVQAQVLELFRTLQRERELSLLYVTHDLAVVAQLCDVLHVMKDGRIHESGPLQEVFDAPAHEYTQRLLRATPRLNAAERLAPSLEEVKP